MIIGHVLHLLHKGLTLYWTVLIIDQTINWGNEKHEGMCVQIVYHYIIFTKIRK